MSDLSELIADVKEQVLYLQELGVDSMNVELALPVTGALSGPPTRFPEKESGIYPTPQTAGSFVSAPMDRSANPEPLATAAKANKPGASRLASLPSLSNRNMTIPSRARPASDPDYGARNAGDAAKIAGATDETLLGDRAPTLSDSGDTIESIRAEIGDCTRCALYAGRKQIVHSTGNFNAELMFVGEAPGADEDEQGFPFVGRAGQLLTKIIESIGMSRDEVFIGNINRCRPPGNRAPEPDETAACRPFILREVAVIKPKAIVVLGATAAHNLLQVKTPISKLRGNFHDYFGVKVMPTFHPAYLLRDPHKKREVWEDMKMVRELLNKH